MQRSVFCRSRRDLSNSYFLAKFRFDTAENEPAKVCPIEDRSSSASRPRQRRGEVMGYLHSRTPAVVHRDVKPENIIVDVQHVRLCEFESEDYSHDCISNSFFLTVFVFSSVAAADGPEAHRLRHGEVRRRRPAGEDRHLRRVPFFSHAWSHRAGRFLDIYM